VRFIPKKGRSAAFSGTKMTLLGSIKLDVGGRECGPYKRGVVRAFLAKPH